MISKLHELYERQFAEALGTVVSHSRPVTERRHLKGREQQLKVVTQAIYAAGRHVFVYGERGVGKTSLAKTAGLAAAGSESFKQIGCSVASSFEEIVRQIVQLFDPKRLATIERSSGATFSYLLGFHNKLTEKLDAPKLTVSLAADILAALDDDGSNSLRVAVIDEVDRIRSPAVKQEFAELVKLLGDRGARITLIFTGVGTDLEAILGYHPSSYRQFAQVPLERLDYQSDLDIIDDALEKFGLSWEAEPMRTARFRIASIANGFPYYVHLLVEKLLYALYYDRDAESVTLDHLQRAFSAAVTDAQEEIRKPYDAATRGRNEKYKLATWASADSWDLERTAEDIYQSYCCLCVDLEKAAVTKAQFLQILAALKRTGYGPILSAAFRKGQYKFTENFVRGYVRLCAASEGVELNDARPGGREEVSVSYGREKRYVDPRRVGAAPAGYGRR